MAREIIKRNLDVRDAAKNAGVFLYEIAEKLGVSRYTNPKKLTANTFKNLMCITNSSELSTDEKRLSNGI